MRQQESGKQLSLHHPTDSAAGACLVAACLVAACLVAGGGGGGMPGGVHFTHGLPPKGGMVAMSTSPAPLFPHTACPDCLTQGECRGSPGTPVVHPLTTLPQLHSEYPCVNSS